MVEPVGVREVLARLEREGYARDIRAVQGLLVLGPKLKLKPEEMIVDAIYRFEGETNLDDEEVIFALSAPKHQLKGTLHVAFGPQMDAEDADVVLRLQSKYSGG